MERRVFLVIMTPLNSGTPDKCREDYGRVVPNGDVLPLPHEVEEGKKCFCYFKVQFGCDLVEADNEN